MDRKTLVQILLILIALTIVISFLFKIFFQDQKSNRADIINDNIKDNDLNLIQGIKYSSKDEYNNIYIIEAENGKASTEDPNIITLFNVSAKLKFYPNNMVTVYSNTAIYNTINNDTEFKQNVELKYDEHNVFCDNMIVEFSNNYAILKDNLIYKSLNTKLFADQIEVDLIERKTKTSMFNKNDKIKIINLDGFN